MALEGPVLSPQQFLELIDESLGTELARETTERFRLREGVESHYDGEEASSPIPSGDLESFVQGARTALLPGLQEVLEYERTRGIKFQTLQELGVGFVGESDNQTGCLVFPYTYRGKVVGIKGRSLDGRKGGMPLSYITLFGFDQLITTEASTCVIVEGETDTLYTRQVLDEAGLQKIMVVGTSGLSFKREWVREFAGIKRIIAVPQADNASRLWIQAIQRAFSNGRIPDPRLSVIELTWPRGVFGKDICDFCRHIPDGAQKFIETLGVSADDTFLTPYLITKDEMLEMAKRNIPSLIPRLLNRRAKMLVVGPPKTFKTWVTLHLAKALIDGTPWLKGSSWIPEAGHKVLYVLEEGSAESVGKRIEMIGIQGDGLNFIHRQIVQLDEVASFQKLYETALKMRPDLIVLDPLASLHTRDENSAQEMMQVMKQLDRLLYILPQTSLVIIHHTPKSSRGARGSGAIWANADVMVELSAPDEKDPTKIEMKLSGRDFEDYERVRSTLNFNPMTCEFDWSVGGEEISVGGHEKEKLAATGRKERVLQCFTGNSWENTYSIIDKVREFTHKDTDTVRTILIDLAKNGKLEMSTNSKVAVESRPPGGNLRTQVFRLSRKS